MHNKLTSKNRSASRMFSPFWHKSLSSLTHICWVPERLKSKVSKYDFAFDLFERVAPFLMAVSTRSVPLKSILKENSTIFIKSAFKRRGLIQSRSWWPVPYSSVLQKKISKQIDLHSVHERTGNNHHKFTRSRPLTSKKNMFHCFSSQRRFYGAFTFPKVPLIKYNYAYLIHSGKNSKIMLPSSQVIGTRWRNS